MPMFKCKRCGKDFKGDSHWKKRQPKYCSKVCMDRYYVETGHMKEMSKKTPHPQVISKEMLERVYRKLKEYPTLSITEALSIEGLSDTWGAVRLKRLIGEGEYEKLKKYRYDGRANALRGMEAERYIAGSLRKDGYKVFRSAGSIGVYDLIAYNEKEMVFIQVKRSGSGKWHMRSEELEKLKADKIPFGRKEIWVWVDGKNRHYPAKVLKESV